MVGGGTRGGDGGGVVVVDVCSVGEGIVDVAVVNGVFAAIACDAIAVTVAMGIVWDG